MAIHMESTLYTDPQTQPPAFLCEHCGGEVYAPSLICGRCERKGFASLSQLSESYRAAAQPLRNRLRQLRQALDIMNNCTSFENIVV